MPYQQPARGIIMNYYSFEIFPLFWLVKTTRIIQITSCCSPDLEWIFAILNQWRQKCCPRETEKTWGQGCVIFGERKNKEQNGETPLRMIKIFGMNNKAVIEFGFRRIWKIPQISEGVIHLGLRPLWITPSLICRLLHILLNLIQ